MNKPAKDRSLRYLSLVALFCIVSVIYLGRLFYIQIAGREGEYDAGVRSRTVTVQAVRGQIYDRNGNVLVKNDYTYDLTFSYAALSTQDQTRVNNLYLKLLAALAECGEEEAHSERFFPLDGTYPYYSFSSAAKDGDSVVYYRLQRVLQDKGLASGIKASEFVKSYVQKNNLLALDADGQRIFSDAEVHRLIRLYYDFDALRFATNGQDYVFAKDVSIRFLTMAKEFGVSGVNVVYNVFRSYAYPGYASHILGSVGPIYSEEWEYYNEQGYQMNAIVGKSGCEAAFESYLHGEDGELVIEEDAKGNVLSYTMKKEPVPGCDVYLTLDIDLQIAAEDALADNIGRITSSDAGATVVMDPTDFSVLAIASYPTYDLSDYDYNELAENEAKPLLNRALNGIYAPGSTFKLGVAALALTDGVVTRDETVACTGKYHGILGCSTHSTPGFEHSAVNVVRALAVSCNSFFSEMGNRLGIDRMEEALSNFGFGKSTGFELGGAVGTLAGPTYRKAVHGEEWTPGMTWQAAIGQSDTQASPLQLAAYVSTILNGGTRYQSHLLKCVYRYGEDTPFYTFTQSDDTILDRFPLSNETVSTIKEGMRQVVTGSSTISAYMKNIPVSVGGKTGTAQTGKSWDNGLFVCAAPYQNPEIVVATVLEKGNSGTAASYTASRVLASYYKVK